MFDWVLNAKSSNFQRKMWIINSIYVLHYVAKKGRKIKTGAPFFVKRGTPFLSKVSLLLRIKK